MKKKLLLSLLLVVTLFTITGCGNSKNKKNEENTKNNKTITVEGMKIQHDKKDDYSKKIEYSYSSSMKLDNLGTERFYSLVDKKENELLKISVNTTYETPEKTLSQLENNYYNNNTTNVKSNKKTVNDMECTYIEYKNTTKDIDYNNHEYYFLFDSEDHNYFYLKIKSKDSLDKFKELEEELVKNVLKK